ncbi:MAG: extracellular catalytic domain type 1 short-chain-length polyhydroxyalkanoate depolymerase [Hasllibacter sp.]
MTKMADILGLVRAGRLTEATEAIQSRLGAAPDAAPGAGGMKDVTPKARALPAPGAPGAERPTECPGEGRPERPAARAPRARPRFRPRAWARPSGPSAPPELAPGARWEARGAALAHRLYVPSRPVPGAPLIVMLHGCTQTPEDFARGTRMCAAAEAEGAHVLWPEQTRAANPNLCWNWFEPAHQDRSGEAGAIADLAASIAAEAGAGGIHVAGLSAGGAMAANLGAARPDVFAGVGIHSGLPAGAARDLPSALSAMRSPSAAMEPLRVPAIVFHGLADRTVAPANGARIAGPGGRARRGEAGGRAYRVRHANGVELWEVEGLAHAWSGGDASGSHADPAGPDATAEMMRFFLAHPGAGRGGGRRG